MANWGIDLWDQHDAVAAHTQKGIDFLDRLAQFFKERCQVELKYARDLKNLVKSFQSKKKDDEDSQFSCFRGFTHLSGELNDLAGQHERLAEELQSHVVQKVQMQSKELREDRKRYLDEASRIQKNLEAYIQQLEKYKRSYEKAYREAQKAQDLFSKADENQELSRKAVEEHKMVARRKAEEFELAKQDYASKLQETNTFQRTFYEQMIPSVFQRMQELDNRKTVQVRDSVKQAAEIEKKIQPIIEKCLVEMIKSAEEVSPDSDAQVVVDRYKSGFDHPGDIPFWNLEDAKSVDNGTLHNHYPPIRSGSVRTVSQVEKKQRKTLIGIFPGSKGKEIVRDDFSDQPPQQRKRKVLEHIKQLSVYVTQETNTRDALMKMKGVYEANPSMGDPNSINGQLQENAVKLENLRGEMSRLQVCLEETEQQLQGNNSQPRVASQVSLSNHTNNNNSSSNNNNNHGQGIRGSADSLVPSRSPSESSIKLATISNNSHHSHPTSVAAAEDVEQDFYEPAPGEDEIVGTCLALYDFEAQSEGALSFEEGEVLLILEADQGDGWTHARRRTSNEEGFVPTSYVKVTIHPTSHNNHSR